MACPECGSDDLIAEDNDGMIGLVCYSCGTAVDDPNKENESMDEEEDDVDFNDGENIENLHLTETVKDSDGNVRDPETAYQVGSDEASDPLQDSVKQHSVTKEQNHVPAVREETTVQTCKSCGGTSLVYDSIHETEHLICEDCGAFTEKQDLVSTQEYTNIGGSSTVYQWSRAPGPRFMNVESQVNKRKAYGVQTIQRMSSQLNWQTYLTDQAVAMYERLYPHILIKHTSNHFKDALCVACMYSVARENKVMITLKTLFHLKNAKIKFVTKALNLLKNISQKPLAHQSVSSLPEHILSGCGFNKDFIDKVSKLVSVCEKGFVTQGRDHSNVVTSVAHLAWISEDFLRRKSVSLTRFCSQHKLQRGSHCAVVQKHVKKLLITLASQIPWVRTTITESNYLHYLDSVATYGLSMVSRANQQGSAPEEDSPSSSRSSSVDGTTSASPALPPLAPPCMRSAKNNVQEESPPQLPPHLTAADLDRKDLSDAEFSDQEIDSYILTPTEAQLKKRLTEKDLDVQSVRKKPPSKTKHAKLDRSKLNLSIDDNQIL
ncbi:transcription factor IIIB 50 kDa subunit-like [Babylonia areolata]|uniref:transcription factor IIIB 50 kDa subunit-like n=1 Tax=Babylonia areolata TaxID=304850 RepID=UPI003FD3C6F1